MKNKIGNMAMVALCALTMLATIKVEAKEGSLQKESEETIAAFEKKDSSFKSLLKKSPGYVVFPNVGKGGFIVGGAHGKGLVYEKEKVVGMASMTQASIGAQVGGQSFAEVIVFETASALSDFKDSNFEMSAEVSAVAAAEGASEAAKFQQGIAVFTLPKKGLMAQASIGGQKFKFEPLK